MARGNPLPLWAGAALVLAWPVILAGPAWSAEPLTLLPGSARLASLGGAGGALPDLVSAGEVGAAAWGLGSRGIRAEAGHCEYYGGLRYESVAVRGAWADWRLGGGARLLTTVETGRDEAGNEVGRFRHSVGSLSLGGGRALKLGGQAFSLGFQGAGSMQQAADRRDQAWQGSGGLAWRSAGDESVVLAAQAEQAGWNTGTGWQPPRLRLSLATWMALAGLAGGDDSDLSGRSRRPRATAPAPDTLVALDVVGDFERGMDWGVQIGVEYTWRGLALRAGYDHGAAAGAWCGGLGISQRGWRADYGLVWNPLLGWTHRVTLAYNRTP